MPRSDLTQKFGGQGNLLVGGWWKGLPEKVRWLVGSTIVGTTYIYHPLVCSMETARAVRVCTGCVSPSLAVPGLPGQPW